VARGATWGRIVGLTSGSPFGFPNEVSYGAAKAALENYTLSAATELARFGITANVVHPPITDTGWVTDGVRAFVERHLHGVHRLERGRETALALACPARHGRDLAERFGEQRDDRVGLAVRNDADDESP